MTIRRLLSVKSALEAFVGLMLLVCPGVVVSLLLGRRLRVLSWELSLGLPVVRFSQSGSHADWPETKVRAKRRGNHRGSADLRSRDDRHSAQRAFCSGNLRHRIISARGDPACRTRSRVFVLSYLRPLAPEKFSRKGSEVSPFPEPKSSARKKPSGCPWLARESPAFFRDPRRSARRAC